MLHITLYLKAVVVVLLTSQAWRPSETPGAPPLETFTDEYRARRNAQFQNATHSKWEATWNAHGNAQLQMAPRNHSKLFTNANIASRAQAFLEMSEKVGLECQFSYNGEENLEYIGKMLFQECRLSCSDERYQAFQFNDVHGEGENSEQECSCVKDVRKAAWPCQKSHTLVCATDRSFRGLVQKINGVENAASRHTTVRRTATTTRLGGQYRQHRRPETEDVDESQTLQELATMVKSEIEAIQERRESAPDRHQSKSAKSVRGTSGVMRGIYTNLDSWTYLVHIDKKDFASEYGVISWMLMFAPAEWTGDKTHGQSNRALMQKHVIARETVKGFWKSPTTFEGSGHEVTGEGHDRFRGKSGKVTITFDDDGCTFVSHGDRCDPNNPKKGSDCVARLYTLAAMNTDNAAQLRQGISYQRDWALSVTLNNEDFRGAAGSQVSSEIKYNVLKAPRFRMGETTAEEKIVGQMEGNQAWGNYFDLHGGFLPYQFNVIPPGRDVTGRIKCYDPREKDFCSVKFFSNLKEEQDTWVTRGYSQFFFLWPLYPSWDTAKKLAE